jgi:hypothetical protein
MELVRVKLETLLELISLREREIPDPSTTKPRGPMDNLNSMKKMMNETIQYLAHIIVKSR